MKCLVLSMYCNQDFFINEENLNRKTWAKDILEGKYNNIDYWSYTSSEDGKYHVNKNTHRLYIPCDDSKDGTTEKTLKCFKLLKDINMLDDYDFIFRTNTSTYINIRLLNALLNTELNTNIIYGGLIHCAKCCCGPFNYSYYACGNSMMIPTKYISILTFDWLNYCKENYDFVDASMCNNARSAYYNIDDNAIGIMLNCYFEYKLNKYHRDFYKMLGYARYDQTNIFSKNIVILERIYNGDRNKEYDNIELTHKIIEDDKNTNMDIVNYYMANTLKVARVVTYS